MTIEEQLFSKHTGKPVLIDSNLLLLLMIGSFNPELIRNFKRTSDYSVSDYEILTNLISYFSGVITTPHILTEVSNLANSLPEWIRLDWIEHFRSRIPLFEERFETGSDLRMQTGFLQYGLTDSALQSISTKSLLFTNDRRLGGYLRSVGGAVLIFDDLVQISKALSG